MGVFIEDYFHQVTVSDGYFENRTVSIGFQGPQGIPGPNMPRIASLKVSGHSYTNPGADVFDGSPVERSTLTPGEEDFTLDYFGRKIMEAFGVQRGGYRNIGVPGNTARDGYWYTLQYENPQRDHPYAPDTSVALVIFGGNDITQGTSTAMLNSFREGMKSMIARYAAAKVFEHDNIDADGQFVLSNDGDWKEILYVDTIGTLSPDYHGSGTGYWSTNITGAYLEFDTPSDFDTGYIHIGFVSGVQGGSCDIYVDGVYVQSHTTSGLNPVSSSSTWRTHTIARVPVDDGNHTIRVTCTGTTSTGYLNVNYWQIEAIEKPIIIVPDMIQPSNPQSLWAVMQDPANTSLYNDEITAAVEYFDDPNIFISDSNTATDGDYNTWYTNKNEQYFVGDGLHFNAVGANRFVNSIYKAATDFLARNNNGNGYSFLYNWQYERDPVYSNTNRASRLYTGSGTPFTIDHFQRDPSKETLGGDYIYYNGKFGITGEKDKGLSMSSEYSRRGSQAKLFHYMPNTPTFVDTFDRVNSTSTLGGSWTAHVGTWGIKNRRAYVATDSGTNLATVNTGSANFYARIKIVDGAVNDGMVIKYVDSNNYMMVIQTLLGLYCYERIGGVDTNLGAISGVSGYDFAVEVNGSTLYVYDPETKSTSTFTVNAALLASTRAGMRSNVSTSYFDIFEYGPYEALRNTQTYAIAAIDTGFSDGCVAMGFSDDGTDDGQGLVFRVQDYRNYYIYLLAPTLGVGAFYKMVNGTATLLGSGALFGGARNTLFRVEFSGPTLSVYSGDTLIESVTDSTFLTGTVHGFQLPASSFDEFDGYVESFGWGQTYFEPNNNDMYIDTDTGVIYGPYDYENSTWGTGNGVIGSGAFVSLIGDHMSDGTNDAYLTIGVDHPEYYFVNGNRLLINNPYQTYSDAAAVIAGNESYRNLVLSGPLGKSPYFFEIDNQHKSPLFAVKGNGVVMAKNFEEFVVTDTSSGTSHTVNVTDGSVHDVTLDDNVVFSFAGANIGRSSSFTLIVRQDGGGGNTITWPGTVLWPGGGTTPTASTTGGAVDVYVFFTNDGGANWYGFQSGADMQ
jgi:lysophospholipase L1-like esterase